MHEKFYGQTGEKNMWYICHRTPSWNTNVSRLAPGSGIGIAQMLHVGVINGARECSLTQITSATPDCTSFNRQDRTYSILGIILGVQQGLNHLGWASLQLQWKEWLSCQVRGFLVNDCTIQPACLFASGLVHTMSSFWLWCMLPPIFYYIFRRNTRNN